MRIHCLGLIFFSVLIFAAHGTPVPPPLPSVFATFLKVLKKAVGPDAGTTTVSVAGGLYMEHHKIRSTADIDVVIQHNRLSIMQLRDKIHQLDKHFTPNLEKICGLTYRDPTTKAITLIDLLDTRVTKITLGGVVLSKLKDTDIPWPKPQEFIKMKIFSAAEREEHEKGIRDLKDVHDLIQHEGHVAMSYKDEAEKTAIAHALDAFFKKYPGKGGWSEAEWRKKLGLPEKK